MCQLLPSVLTHGPGFQRDAVLFGSAVPDASAPAQVQVVSLRSLSQLISSEADQTTYLRRSSRTKRPHAQHSSKSSLISTLGSICNQYSFAVSLHFFCLQGPVLLPNATDTDWGRINAVTMRGQKILTKLAQGKTNLHSI